jgi:hypothetical protein
MRFHRLALPLVFATLAWSIVLLTACGKKQEEAPPLSLPPTGPPVVIITQTPEYPRPGQFVQYPRGLVAALWSDGRIVRCADPSMVGKSYVTLRNYSYAYEPLQVQEMKVLLFDIRNSDALTVSHTWHVKRLFAGRTHHGNRL